RLRSSPPCLITLTLCVQSKHLCRKRRTYRCVSNSDVVTVPLNAERVEDNRVSDCQFIFRNHNLVGVADNWIKRLTPALMVDNTVTVFTSRLGVVPVAVIHG